MVHVSSSKRISEFNKIVSDLKFKYDGKMRSGYSQPFPYKAELWIYKMKKEVVPEFLKFVNGNTSQVMTSERPLQGIINFAVFMMSFTARIKDKFISLKRKIHGKPPDKTRHIMQTVDMSKIEKGKKMVDGWGYTKVIGIIPDTINSEGEEEL